MSKKRRPKRSGPPRKSGGKPGKPGQRAPQPSPDEGHIDLTLRAMAYGGSALGSHQRRTVFIPYTIPGERVRARLVQRGRSVDFAEGVQLLAASADRVFPPCPHFGPGRCWGCQWQHIAYDAQVLLKQDVLADQLARLGHFDDATLDAAMRPTLPSPDVWQYNHHMTFARTPDGALGFPRVDERSIEPISVCHILHADLLALYETLDLDFPEAQRVQMLVGSDGATMLILALSSETTPSLHADFPTSVNVILPDNEPMNLVGDAHITYTIGGRDFRVTAGVYFRPNVAQMTPLVGRLLEVLNLTGDEAVLDLYAGVGVYSAFVAPRARLVTLVESYPPAATDADVNLADFDHVDIVEGGVEDVLASLLAASAAYDAAIVDPPASGLSKAALSALVDLQPERIAYISSSPPTLARDAQQLARAGYELRQVIPVDVAPHTYYIDALALMKRRQ